MITLAQIIERFEPEFEKLLWLTMMLPWHVPAPPAVETAGA